MFFWHNDHIMSQLKRNAKWIRFGNLFPHNMYFSTPSFLFTITLGTEITWRHHWHISKKGRDTRYIKKWWRNIFSLSRLLFSCFYHFSGYFRCYKTKLYWCLERIICLFLRLVLFCKIFAAYIHINTLFVI